MEICRNIKIRILAFMMAFWLAFSVSYNDYQEVEALEWAIPTVAFDTAIKFLLGLLGVSLTSKALHDNVDWNQVQQDCVDFQIQKGNDAVAVGEWWEDVAKGTLNQASSCWSSFKEWVQSMLSSSDNVVGNKITVSSDNVFGLASFDYYITPTIDGIYYSNENFDFSFYSSTTYDVVNLVYIPFYLYNNFTYPVFAIKNNILENGSVGSLSLNMIRKSDNAIFSNNAKYLYTQTFTYNDDTIYILSAFSFSSVPITDTLKKELWLALYGDSAIDSIFDSANDNIQDTAITTDTPTTTTIPDTLPLPWDNVSDTAEGVDDAISGLQEQVAEGVISLEDYWERVQELINAMAIDTTTDEVLPTTQNPDTGENETIQDKIQENTSNDSFTLGGMEKVFPFCIPWDIYGFVTLLVAPPVAPVINYPFYNPVTGQDINISIDFSDWENVVILFRYVLDFLLIIGLLLLARQLAGAGGDD